MHPELEPLIEAVIKDGVISDKEREDSSTISIYRGWSLLRRKEGAKVIELPKDSQPKPKAVEAADDKK